MIEHVKADGPACILCAARTPTREGALCEPWKLGTGNKTGKKSRSNFVLGRRVGTGTTMRPYLCPHPDSKVSTMPSIAVVLKKLLKK